MLALALPGGWFIYTGTFTIFAAISFWTIGPVQTVYIFTNHTLQYLKIPFGRFSKLIQRTLTFVFPLATFTYFPVMSISGFTPTNFLSFSSLPAGIGFFLLSLVIWKLGVRRYHSTGS